MNTVERIPVKAQWLLLLDKVRQIEKDIGQSEFPVPTPQMCDFLIAGEDRRFYRHPGVDAIALCRAFWKTVFYGESQGGSTIAMQFVRTMTGRFEKTWRRKIVEIVFAVRLTRNLPKGRLPTLYLWVAYYGSGMDNFKQACSKLAIDPQDASAIEAAKLVARLKYPEPQRCGHKHANKIHRRGRHIMATADRMHEHLRACRESSNGTVQSRRCAQKIG